MSGECDECGEHCLECTCFDDDISCTIQEKIAPIYAKYKDYPNELIDALEYFIETVDCDREARWLYDREEGNYDKKRRCRNIPLAAMDNMIFGWWPFFEKKMEKELKEDKRAYICRVCATSMGAVPPRNHVCTWHRAKCNFCGEEANLCHTSDWNWPDNRDLEEGREF